MSKRLTIIYNPHAGAQKLDDALYETADFWERVGWSVSITPTRWAGHATQLAAQAAASDRALVLAVGGDGTLHEVANGLAETNTAVGLLPMGTGNSFAKELCIPRPGLMQRQTLLAASKALVNGRVQKMDLGRDGGGRYWALWTGAGLDGHIIHQVEPRSKLFKQLLGRTGYVAKGLLALPTYRGRPGRVVVDGQTIEGEMLFVSIDNCRLYGGGEFAINPDGVLDDGLFEVWVFRGKRWPVGIRYIAEVGLQQHDQHPQVTMLRGRTVSVEMSPPAPCHMDAEPLPETPLSCRAVPHALRLLVPQAAPSDLFSEPGRPLAAWPA